VSAVTLRLTFAATDDAAMEMAGGSPSRSESLNRNPNRSILQPMKVETAIVLSDELIEAIDSQSGRYKGRSDFVEAAVRAYLAKIVREENDAKDLAIINRRADELNLEAQDVLTYQAPL